ncbi:MAG: hypothetical protein P4L16_02515, partial [Chlamydiales bacterium]|nr:hypothetical protein [Chlamydiales bacterium]
YPIATRSRIRWKEEDLFNDLQCRGFAIRHDFNRAPVAQSVRIYLILIQLRFGKDPLQNNVCINL